MKTPTDDITPVPEDAETLQTYIQDRRVIGVSHLLRCGFCAWGMSYTFSLLKDIPGTTVLLRRISEVYGWILWAGQGFTNVTGYLEDAMTELCPSTHPAGSALQSVFADS